MRNSKIFLSSLFPTKHPRRMPTYAQLGMPENTNHFEAVHSLAVILRRLFRHEEYEELYFFFTRHIKAMMLSFEMCMERRMSDENLREMAVFSIICFRYLIMTVFYHDLQISN